MSNNSTTRRVDAGPQNKTNKKGTEDTSRVWGEQENKDRFNRIHVTGKLPKCNDRTTNALANPFQRTGNWHHKLDGYCSGATDIFGTENTGEACRHLSTAGVVYHHQHR